MASSGSYATVRHLTPVERGHAFQAALAAIESGDHQRALRLLGPLAEDYPRSPLVLFYYSLELAQANQVDEAAKLYAQALQAPRADARVRRLGEKESWAGDPVRIAGNEAQRGNEDHPGEFQTKTASTYPDLAHKAFAIAIRLGSTNEKVFLADAIYDEEHNGSYDLALSKLRRSSTESRRYPRAAEDVL